MRVLYVYKFNPQDPTEIALRRWLPKVFAEHSIFCFLPSEKKRGSENGAMHVNARLMAAARAFRPTHVLSWVPYLNVHEVQELKKLGAGVTAAVNGVASMSSGGSSDQATHLAALKELEYYLLPHFPHVDLLKGVGISAVKFPFCVDPDTYKPSPIFEGIGRMLGFRSVFIGNFGPKDNAQGVYRANLIREIAKAGKTLLVSDRCYADHGLKAEKNVSRIQLPNFGRQGWLNRMLNLGQFSVGVDFFDDVELYNRLLVSPILPYDNARDGFTMRPRTFWSLGAGRVFLIERYPDIQQLFEDGKELLLWDSFEEARDHIERITKDPQKLRAIAAAGRAKVLARHTAEIRLQQLRALWESGKIPNFDV